MGSKPATTRDSILNTAFDLAMERGVCALDTRTIARECGVAVGTIYNYFPDIAALRTEVIGRFWRQALERADLRTHASQGGGAIAYCRRLSIALHESMEGFRTNWLRDLSTLDGRTRQRTRDAELTCFQSIKEGIRDAIEADARIVAAARERLDAAELADFIWASMLDSIRRGLDTDDVLFNVLSLALYGGSAPGLV